MTQIREMCSCGASIVAEDQLTKDGFTRGGYAQDVVKKWRETHHHKPTTAANAPESPPFGADAPKGG